MPSTASRSRTRERMVRHQIVCYSSFERRPDGEVVETGRIAHRGDVVVLTASEEARLEAQGSLAGIDQSLESLDAEDEENYRLYREGRVAASPKSEVW